MNLRTLLRRYSPEQLLEAVRLSKTEGKRNKLEAERDALQAKLARVERKLAALGGNGAASTAKTGRRGRRVGFKVSASTRAKMKAAALRRYAKNKPEESKPARRKWRMSAQGRQRIADAARRRWAAVKAAKS